MTVIRFYTNFQLFRIGQKLSNFMCIGVTCIWPQKQLLFYYTDDFGYLHIC